MRSLRRPADAFASFRWRIKLPSRDLNVLHWWVSVLMAVRAGKKKEGTRQARSCSQNLCIACGWLDGFPRAFCEKSRARTQCSNLRRDPADCRLETTNGRYRQPREGIFSDEDAGDSVRW